MEENQNDFALLVVDMWWETEIKNRERGYAIELPWSVTATTYEKRMHENYPQSLAYPHGTLRAGLDAIHDVVRMAHELDKVIYGVVSEDGCTPADELLDKALHPYIPRSHLFTKKGYSACDNSDLVQQLQDAQRVMVVGFDRDYCVYETIKDTVDNGVEVITSEVLMLTCNNGNKERAMQYFQENTTYLETLCDVWNYLDPGAKLYFVP